MAETRYALLLSGQATFETVTGIASLILAPASPGERWEVGRMASSATITCELKVYRNDVQPQNLIDTTKKGSADISDNEPPHKIYQGDRMIFVWTANTVPVAIRQTAVIRIEGTRIVPGNRGYGGGR